LDTIRKIRNEFAHSLIEKSFEKSPIREWVLGLKIETKSSADQTEEAEKTYLSKRSTYRFREISAKIGGFLQASIVIAASDMPELEKSKVFAALGSEE